MTDTPLFPDHAPSFPPIEHARTMPDAILAGHRAPDATNPFCYSSILWQAFNLGQYLALCGLPPTGWRRSRGNSFAHRSGLVVHYYFESAGFCLSTSQRS